MEYITKQKEYQPSLTYFKETNYVQPTELILEVYEICVCPDFIIQ